MTVNEIDPIRRQMAQIRHDLHRDVSGVVGSVEEAMDWRRLPRRYPLACVVAALLAGYLLVPRRAKHFDQGEPSTGGAVAATPPRLWSGIAGRMLSLVWPIAEQAIQAYAVIWIESHLMQYLHRPPGGASYALREHRQSEVRGNDIFSDMSSDIR
jgi:hypothetical protein